MQVNTTILFAFLSLNIQAQINNCPKYDLAMKNGHAYFSRQNYDRALIEFQSAQIAARECGKDVKEPATELKKVFDSLNAQRKNALKAQRSAEKADSITKTALKDAQDGRDSAELYRQKAEEEKNKTSAFNLALQSFLEEDSIKKMEQALEAFRLNQEFNENKWIPEIARALLMSIPESSISKIFKIESGIIDIVKINDLIIIITEAGEIRECNLAQKTNRVLWNKDNFYYLNNSVYYDSANKKLFAKDKNMNTYFFQLKPSDIEFTRMDKKEKNDSVILFKNNFYLTSKNLMHRRDNNYSTVIHFPNKQYATTFEITSNKEIIAAGTQNGWLYIKDANQRPQGRLFQNENTQVNDIAFDQDGEFIATAGMDSKFRFNKINFIGERPSIELSFNAWVNAILFLENMRILIGTSDGNLFLLNYDQNFLAEECSKTLNAIKK